ncbi:hypothetical protein ACU635_36075 [[Actinomadura] parvosata]|uniref:hypothetical protein n=1 Tax=[Actinomadura] parvosata TaxID=1955412 RepID=UPI00406C73D0
MAAATPTTPSERYAPPPGGRRDPRSFVDPDVWDRQIKLLVRDHPWDTVMAERCFGQAIAYLITAMEKHGHAGGFAAQPVTAPSGQPVRQLVQGHVHHCAKDAGPPEVSRQRGRSPPQRR